MKTTELRLSRIEELLESILENQPVPDELDYDQCRRYLRVTNLKTVSNYVCTGKIPKDAVITLVNGERKFIKSRLRKPPESNQLSLFPTL